MEYNDHTYITISHNDCETLNLGEGHRTSNDGSICILEFASIDAIPTEIAAVMIQTYNHQEALALVAGAEWVSELPL
jgi:hypothetical protein